MSIFSCHVTHFSLRVEVSIWKKKKSPKYPNSRKKLILLILKKKSEHEEKLLDPITTKKNNTFLEIKTTNCGCLSKDQLTDIINF